MTSIPQEMREILLKRLETEDLQHARLGGGMSVLAAALDSATVQRIFAKLCGLHQVVTSQPEQRHELEWVISRQLEDLLRLTAPKVTEPCRRPILGERQESFTTGGITFGSTIPSSF